MKEKSKYGMPPPDSRAAFEHNLFMLVDDVERHKDNPKYLIGRYRVLGESLEHARYLPNRRIELATIDEQVRLHANMQNWLEHLSPVAIKEKGDKK